MLVQREEGPVGSWWFEDRRHPVNFADPQDVEELLHKLQVAAEILDKHELLAPEHVTFSGWFGVDPEAKPVKIDGDEVDVAIHGASALLQLSLDALRHSVWQSGMRYPITVDVTGTGKVLLPSGGSQSAPDVAWLRGRASDGHVVEVRTQIDAWLPFGLDGRPQGEIAERNAPRLEAALREIQDRLGVSALDEDQTEYAITDGFRLKNITDIDGEVIAVR